MDSVRFSNATDAHLSEGLVRGHGVPPVRWLLWPRYRFANVRFWSHRLRLEDQRPCARLEDVLQRESTNRLYTRLSSMAGIEGGSTQSGRRTLAVKLKRRGLDLRHNSEILGIKSLEAVKKLFAGASALGRHGWEKHLMEVQRLTPDEFKAVFKQRGWTGKTLALRWEVSEAWISKIIKNPHRAAHWDDAVRGLPNHK